MAFDDIIEINGQKMTKGYIEGLSHPERELLIEPIFQYFRKLGFSYPDRLDKVKDSYKKIIEYQPNLELDELYNNSNHGTNICKYFCKSFYDASDKGGRTMKEVFSDDTSLKKLIRNRLGLCWNDGANESFNLSPKMMIQGMRSMRLVSVLTLFKPEIAKYVYMKYSNEGDLCYDYSSGFGARMLGCVSAGRRYLGVDPLTVPELEVMAQTLGLKDYMLMQRCSEDFKTPPNIFDLAFSSPPYNNLEIYSKDDTQAYNKGEKYFFETYWAETLKNIKNSLKARKYFILNVKEDRMLKMAKMEFEYKEKIGLKTVRSHLNKTGKDDAIKYEYIYVFINNK